LPSLSSFKGCSNGAIKGLSATTPTVGPYLVGELDAVNMGSPWEEERGDVLEVEVVLRLLLGGKYVRDAEIIQTVQCGVGASCITGKLVAVSGGIYTQGHTDLWADARHSSQAEVPLTSRRGRAKGALSIMAWWYMSQLSSETMWNATETPPYRACGDYMRTATYRASATHSTLARNGHLVGVAAKERNVLLHPQQSNALVEHACKSKCRQVRNKKQQ
jgi:hypothetical protein